jgi:hypothetical protein
MGFGKKTDYPTGRVLDLDKSYRYIIKPATEAAGYECVRADEIQHAGNINVPMYEQLLNADVVVADVSTYNANAFYELGVRHALKPYTTITIAEDKLVFPFDVGQIAIRTYHHLGEGIDFGEVERMRDELTKAIKIVGQQAKCDSPVYTFLRGLNPPAMAKDEAERAHAAAPPPDAGAQPTVRALMDKAENAMEKTDFVTAKSLLSVVRSMMPTDAYVCQMLALATYKSESPTPEAALGEAAAILDGLEPATCNDPETLGLYGAVHKRFWDRTSSEAHLEKAIWAREKGFYVKNDYYNGINLAFLLNVRSALRAGAEPVEAVTDFVLAQRTRRRVIEICQALQDPKAANSTDSYWITATLAEAWLGLGDEQKAREFLEKAKASPDATPRKVQTTEQQLDTLRKLLAQSPLSRISFIAAT